MIFNLIAISPSNYVGHIGLKIVSGQSTNMQIIFNNDLNRRKI